MSYIGEFETFDDFVQWHRAAEERQRQAVIWSCNLHHENDISRIMGRFELESDEIMTAREKAMSLIARKGMIL